MLTGVVEAARELTGARYAALGVLNQEKSGLERFIYTGIDDHTRAEIGPLPRGRGILGELIREPRPLRLARIDQHPRSYGFPANHPPMTTFVGVTVTIRGEPFGNLYLTDKARGAEFDESDEALLVVLADWAAVAIDNARAYENAEERREELERAVRGLEATASLSRELQGEVDMVRITELISKRARALARARSLAILQLANEEYEVVACAGELSEALTGRRLPAHDSPADDAVRSGLTRRFDGAELHWFTKAGIHSGAALVIPMRRGGLNEGVLVALDPLDTDTFSADDELLLASFTTAAAAAIAAGRALETNRLKLSIEAAENERRRWARELHDETLQELGALKVMQESALQAGDPEMLRRALTNAAGQVTSVIESLDRLITELRPAALDQLGCQAAIETLVEQVAKRSALEIEADFDLAFESGRTEVRPDPELESAAYRIVQEALNNVVKHSGASDARVALIEEGSELRVTVEDNGRGLGASEGDRQGFGLIGMRERAERLGGELTVGSGPSGGARVTARLPLRPGKPGG